MPFPGECRIVNWNLSERNYGRIIANVGSGRSAGFAVPSAHYNRLPQSPDRGWAFSKAIGLALLAFCVWLPLMWVQALPFSRLFIAGVLLILTAFSMIGFIRVRRDLAKLVCATIFYIAFCEAIFLGMAFLLGWLRSYCPDILSCEMFMITCLIAAL